MNIELTPLEKLIRITGLTQKQFADQVGSTQAKISYLKKSNNIKVADLQEYCKVFNINIKDVF
mgnify:CR=1 FL=1